MSKDTQSSSDKFLLAMTFSLEGQNVRGLLLRLLGVVAAMVALVAKIWLFAQGNVR